MSIDKEMNISGSVKAEQKSRDGDEYNISGYRKTAVKSTSLAFWISIQLTPNRQSYLYVPNTMCLKI